MNFLASSKNVDRDENSRFAGDLSDLTDILSSQRRLLLEFGRGLAHGAVANAATARIQGLADNSYEEIAILSSSIGEIKARQETIEAAYFEKRDLEAIALDAFISAMHRIRTNLDVALGATEEVSELSQEVAANGAAAEAARAIRLVYHYTNELSELSTISRTMVGLKETSVDANAAFKRAIAEISRVASDANVELYAVSGGENAFVRAKSGLLERALTYLLLTSVVSPGVSIVRCSIRRERRHGEELILFLIADDGQPVSLETRAQTHTYAQMISSDNKPSLSDSAGFAVVRRLAGAMGGTVEREMVEGQGATIIMSIPAFGRKSDDQAA